MAQRWPQGTQGRGRWQRCHSRVWDSCRRTQGKGKLAAIFFPPRLICKAPASPGFEIFCKKKLKKWLVPDSGARMGLGR